MPAQGTKHGSALAIWLNRNGMTSREFMRRVGITGFKKMSTLLDGTETPQLVLAFEIERVTEGGVPMEAWMASKHARAFLKEARLRQPEEYRPRKDKPPPETEDDDEE